MCQVFNHFTFHQCSKTSNSQKLEGKEWSLPYMNAVTMSVRQTILKRHIEQEKETLIKKKLKTWGIW